MEEDLSGVVELESSLVEVVLEFPCHDGVSIFVSGAKLNTVFVVEVGVFEEIIWFKSGELNLGNWVVDEDFDLCVRQHVSPLYTLEGSIDRSSEIFACGTCTSPASLEGVVTGESSVVKFVQC